MKETEKTKSLAIGTFPKRSSVLPGESFFVESTFENRGLASVQFPSSAGLSPFAYDLLSAKDRIVRYRVSDYLSDRRRTVERVPLREFEPQIVAPSHSVERQEDLAELSDEDFAPGEYFIRTQYPGDGLAEVISALSPFTILVPRIESFSSVACGLQETLVTAYAHRCDDGGVLLLQREAYADPRRGVAFQRIQLESGSPVQIAITIDAVVAGNGRWFGWLRDGFFEAASGWGNKTFPLNHQKPVSIGATDTILLSPGFQVDVGIGMFGCILNADGMTYLKVLRASAQGIAVVFETELAPQEINNVRWNYRPASGFAIFWQDADGQLFRRLLDREGKPLGEAIIMSSSPTLAWDVAPLGNPELLSIVRANDGRYSFCNLSDGGPDDVSSRVAPTMLAEPPEPLSFHATFAFCATATSTKIIAIDAGKIWSTSIDLNGEGMWQKVAEATQPTYLHAFALRGQTWAEWFEPELGLRRAKLP